MSTYASAVISPFILAVLALAVARMCVLMTTDTITQPARDWVKARYGPEHMLTKGAHCNWCWSVWLAFPMTFITYLATGDGLVPFWKWAITALAVSFVASYLADKVS